MKVKLTPRLEAVASLVPAGARVADIGSDHAYVPVALIRGQRAVKVIASDVHQGPVENALSVVRGAGLEGCIEVRLGSGFDVYAAGEVNTAVLAGMGGFLIRELMTAAMPLVKSLDCLVLQPMVAIRELRCWLLEQGFEVLEERVAREGRKFYEVFSVRYCGKPWKTVDFKTAELGFQMIRAEDEVSLAYLDHRIQKTQGVIASLMASKNQEATELSVFQARLRLYEEVLACLSIQKKSSN